MSNLQTPYVTPTILRNSATGVEWGTLPQQQGQGKDAAILDICWRTTSRIDAYCGMPLRATINSEPVEGPDFYMTSNALGTVIILQRPPIVSVTGITVLGTNDFLSTPTSVTAGQWRIMNPLIGELGTLAPDSSGVLPFRVRLAPGWVNWSNGRNGYLVTVTYVNGWPHAGLTSTCAAGVTTLPLDDVTGMAGMACTIRDGANTEVVTTSAPTAASGAGNVTCTATQYAHNPGVMVTTLPGSIELAAVKYATAEALTKGAMVIGAPTMSGTSAASDGGGPKAFDLIMEAEELCLPFRRVV